MLVSFLLRRPETVTVTVRRRGGGTVDRLGVGYQAVKARNPGIVYCSISAFGQAGPNCERPAHDLALEIRAPRGTKAGVSGFQIHFASKEIFTPGDQVDALVAMNPAALSTNLADLVSGGILIVNEDAFSKRNLEKARVTAHEQSGREQEQERKRHLPGNQ